MRRLRDEAGEDPVAVRGIELLRGTPPTARSPESKRRVWRSIQRAQATKTQGVQLTKLRMAAVVIGVLCVAGSAGAVIAARRWIAPAFRGTSSPGPVAPIQRHRSPAAHTVALRRDAPSPTPPSAAPAPEVQAPAAPRASARPGAPVAAPRAPVRRVAPLRRLSPLTASGVGLMARSEPFGASAASAGAIARERTEVLDAMVALRRDRDPVTAGRMLDTYLVAHPTGTLREEALVLAIEAAAARDDVTLARSLARQYQSAYPAGRFRQFAQATAGP